MKNALYGERRTKKNSGKLKLIWHIFRSRQSPDCLTSAFKESWTDIKHGEDLKFFIRPGVSLKLWEIRYRLQRDNIKERGEGSIIHYLTKHRDVIHVIVIRQGRHESVAETGLAAAHGALVLLTA